MLWIEQKLTTCILSYWNETSAQNYIIIVLYIYKYKYKYHTLKRGKMLHKSIYRLTKYLKQFKLLQKKNNQRMFTNDSWYMVWYVEHTRARDRQLFKYDKWVERYSITSTNSREKKSQIYATECKPYALHFPLRFFLGIHFWIFQ